MSTPSNGSWNEGQEPGPQYGAPGGQPSGGQPGYGQPSLGQGFGQQQAGYAPGGQPGGPPPQQAAGPYQQPGGGTGGNGIADLFSDFGFRKSLTEAIASLAFLITVVWAILQFVQTVAHAWGSQDFGGNDVKNMGGFEAMMTTLTGLAWMVFVVVVARLLLELCVNVARLARDRG